MIWQKQLFTLFILTISIFMVSNFAVGTTIQNFFRDNTYLLDDNIQWLPSSTSLWNIYESAYNLALVQDQHADQQAVEYISKYLNETWWCSLSVNDAYNLYSVSPSAKLLMKRSYNQWIQLEAQWWDFISSCKKVISCVYPDLESENQLYNKSTYQTCIDIVTIVFNNNKSTFQSYNHLATTNIWDEMYANWTLKDSPFDLLLDIEYIWQLLFSENKKVNNYSFYGNDIEKASNFDEYFSQFPRPFAWKNSSINENDDYIEWLSWSVSESMIDGDKKYWKVLYWQKCEDSDGCVCNKKIIIKWNICTYEPTAWNNNVIQWNQLCVTSNDSNFIDWNKSSSSKNDNQIQESDYISYLKDDESDLNLDEIWDFIRSVNNWLLGSESARMDSCLASCNDLSVLDRGICSLQCACKMTSDPDSIYSIKFCLQKSNKKPVVDWKMVFSVEEMLDEMINILVNMKENWALMKHKMSDEFWEIWLQDIRFSDIFIFDFVILFKPIYDSYWTQRSWEKEKRVAVEENRIAERNILKYYGDMSISEEKNKYLLLYDPIIEKAAYEPAYQQETIHANFQDATEMKSALSLNIKDVEMDAQKMSNYTVLDEIWDFLENNKIFWWSVYSTLDGFRLTSKALDSKIKNK